MLAAMGRLSILAFTNHFSTRAAFQGEITLEELYVAFGDLAEKEIPKGDAPCFLFGKSAGGKTTDELESLSALVLDGDKLPNTSKTVVGIERFKATLRDRDVGYVYTERVGPKGVSFHFIIPLSAPAPPTSCRRHLREWCAGVMGLELDKATDRPTQVLYAHTRRPNDPATVAVDWFNGTEGLEVLESSKATASLPLPVEPTVADDELLALFDVLGHKRSRDYFIRCPYDHVAATKTKTMYKSSTKQIICLADQCFGKPIEYFIAGLPPEKRTRYYALKDTALQALLPPARPRVSVEEAQRIIRQHLDGVVSNGTQWKILRVTTGAGKTGTALRMLEEEEEGPRTLIGTYSNKLVREISSDLDSLGVTHRKQVGTLAVLNDDGTPACHYYEDAKELQDAGVNIVKALCLNGCEYKDSCRALHGRVSGSGNVTVTNHALVPVVLEELGGHPRIVYDESPAVVEEIALGAKELEALANQIARDAESGVGFDRVFSHSFALKMKPVADWLRWLGGGVAEANRKWAKTRETRLGAVELSEGPLEQLRAAMQETMAPGRGGVLACVDRTRLKAFKTVLGALGKLEGLLQGELVQTPTGVVVASVGEEAAVFRDRGGVILDATAPVAEWRALCGDRLEVVDVLVEDKVQASRTWVYTKGVSKTAMGKDEAKAAVEMLDGWLSEGKVMLFTYKDFKERFVGLGATVRHYGETRGSNEAWEDGYDVFVTVGDPLKNPDALVRTGAALGMEMVWEETAAAELGQCHGRSRSARQDKPVRHVHFGKICPEGWDESNAKVIRPTETAPPII